MCFSTQVGPYPERGPSHCAAGKNCNSALQPDGKRLHVLQRDQTVPQLVRLRRGVRLGRRVRRQQQPRAELQQPGRHHHPVALLAQRHRRRRLPQGRFQLLEQHGERQPAQVELLCPRQRQQLLQWPIEAVQSEQRCPLPRLLGCPAGSPYGSAAIGSDEPWLAAAGSGRSFRAAPLPSMRRGQSGGRGVSPNRKAGQSMASRSIAACGVSPWVKKP